jgi:V8-like Glu-specific endopeptidase
VVTLGSGNDGAIRMTNPEADNVPGSARKLPWQWAGLLLIAVTALIVATVVGLIRAPAAAPVAATRAVSEQPGATPSAAVGALFTRQDGHLVSHFCTGSTVASRKSNLVITAAHCVSNLSLSPAGSVVFAPGYADGRFPYGLWAVTRKFVDIQWSSDQNQDNDVAFLQVVPLRPPQVRASQAAPAGSLAHVTGAEQLRFDAALPAQIRAIGYPDGSDQPVACWARATAFRPDSLDQVKFVCPGFTDGTSGGPFLTGFKPASGLGTIIGVIGGYQQGGDSPSISYSSAFTASIRKLYEYVLRVS